MTLPVAFARAEMLNFCANNYLGLSNHPAVLDAARRSLDQWGYGLSSVRFICGTQSVHKQLEQRIARFHGMDDAILYNACFDANAGMPQGIPASCTAPDPDPAFAPPLLLRLQLMLLSPPPLTAAGWSPQASLRSSWGSRTASSVTS